MKLLLPFLLLLNFIISSHGHSEQKAILPGGKVVKELQDLAEIINDRLYEHHQQNTFGHKTFKLTYKEKDGKKLSEASPNTIAIMAVPDGKGGYTLAVAGNIQVESKAKDKENKHSVIGGIQDKDGAVIKAIMDNAINEKSEFNIFRNAQVDVIETNILPHHGASTMNNREATDHRYYVREAHAEIKLLKWYKDQTGVDEIPPGVEIGANKPACVNCAAELDLHNLKGYNGLDGFDNVVNWASKEEIAKLRLVQEDDEKTTKVRKECTDKINKSRKQRMEAFNTAKKNKVLAENTNPVGIKDDQFDDSGKPVIAPKPVPFKETHAVRMKDDKDFDDCVEAGGEATVAGKRRGRFVQHKNRMKRLRLFH